MDSVSKRDWYAAAAVCALLVLAVALVFGQTARFGFVNFDDNIYVYENPHMAQGLSGESIAWACTTFTSSNWHPLTWMSHLLDSQLYGQKNAGGHHMTNVALHAAVAIALFLVLWRMTGSLWPSAFAAMVFAVHPLRVESVAWVAERKDLLSGLFFMLTLAAYLGYVRHPFSWRRYLLVIAVFALGLTAKPMLVTLPCVLLLLDYWPLGRMPFSPSAAEGQIGGGSRRLLRLIAEKIPLFVLAIGSSIVTSMAQQNAMVSLDAAPISLRISNALVSSVAYIGQFFWPVNLAVFYPYPQGGHPMWAAVAAGAVLIAISAAALLCRRKRPYLLVGWLWYLGMLVPVIGLVQVGSQSMADRYTYLPQIGLAIAIVWGIADATARWPRRRLAFAAASCVLGPALIVAAMLQTSYWRNGETLWSRALTSTEQNLFAHSNLALIYCGDGRLDDAIALYHRSLEFAPTPKCSADIHYNLANALGALGQNEEAIAEYRKAIKLNPDFAEAHGNLGTALANSGRLDEAVAQFLKALKLKPDNAGINDNLGMAYYQQGKTAAAVVHWREAVRLNPTNVHSVNRLAKALATCPDASVRDGKAALELALWAVQLSNSRDAIPFDTLAAAYAEAGNFPEAVKAAKNALRLASREKNPALTESIKKKIALYEARTPFREPHSPSTAAVAPSQQTARNRVE